MPFQFSVDEGCLGGRLQSSTWKHAASAREVFHLFLRVREASSSPSQYCQHLLKQRGACQGLHLHPTCLHLGVCLCSKGAASPKPPGAAGALGLHTVHSQCRVAASWGRVPSSLPCSCSTACQAASAPLLSRGQATHCHSTQVGVLGFAAVLPILALGNSPELPLLAVSFEVRASTEAGQPPISATGGNPSSTRMLNLWPSSNLAHLPLPTVHYQCLHSCRCVSPEPNLVISGSHRSTVCRPL